MAEMVVPRLDDLESRFTEVQDNIVEVQGIYIEQTLEELTNLKEHVMNLQMV